MGATNKGFAMANGPMYIGGCFWNWGVGVASGAQTGTHSSCSKFQQLKFFSNGLLEINYCAGCIPKGVTGGDCVDPAASQGSGIQRNTYTIGMPPWIEHLLTLLSLPQFGLTA